MFWELLFAFIGVLHQQLHYTKLGLLLVGFAIITVAKNVA
jgi:hypothetical protein